MLSATFSAVHTHVYLSSAHLNHCSTLPSEPSSTRRGLPRLVAWASPARALDTSTKRSQGAVRNCSPAFDNQLSCSIWRKREVAVATALLQWVSTLACLLILVAPQSMSGKRRKIAQFTGELCHSRASLKMAAEVAVFHQVCFRKIGDDLVGDGGDITNTELKVSSNEHSLILSFPKGSL